ncbi:MAG: transposase, partial [Candidatus Heimdallarchaeota archaeon]
RICDGKGTLEKTIVDIDDIDDIEQIEQIEQEKKSKETGDNTDDQATSSLLKGFDSLQRTIKFDRKLMQAVKQFNTENRTHPFSLIKAVVNHIEKYKPKEAISAFRQAFMPKEMIAKISNETGCDQWVEKTKLGNIIMWTLSFFLQNKTEDLAIQEIANASASLLGRELSDDGRAVDHNTIGVRLEKEKLIKAFEMMLQLCSAKLESQAFEDNGSLVNIYYDWFFLVKSGNVWKVCQEVGRTKESNAIKIGIGIEWESKAVVSLIMHGERHSNDVVSFREKLMVTQRRGLVHISDLGPFFTRTMKEIRDNQQHFIIKLKKKIKYSLVHQIFLGRDEFELDTPSKTKIIVFEEKLIRLNANPDLGEVKYIRFQYHCQRTGKFRTIELISSLPLSAEQIIQSHAWRWVATETEFNILQHQFGLEKLYFKKPEKAWLLLLLVLCGKMIMEFTFRA